MRLKPLLPKLLREESEATKQAHNLGLTHTAYGQWADDTGKIVARTVNGKLVRVTADEPVPDAEPVQKQGIPGVTQAINFNDPYATKHHDMVLNVPVQAPAYDVDRAENWYRSTPPEQLAQKLHQVLATAHSAQDLAMNVGRAMGADRSMGIRFDGDSARGYSGIHMLGQRMIAYSSQTVNGLKKLAAMGPQMANTIQTAINTLNAGTDTGKRTSPTPEYEEESQRIARDVAPMFVKYMVDGGRTDPPPVEQIQKNFTAMVGNILRKNGNVADVKDWVAGMFTAFGPPKSPEVQQFAQSYEPTLGTDTGAMSRSQAMEIVGAATALSTVVHENIHAKDHLLAKGANREKNPSFILEGLTERRARQVMDAMFPGFEKVTKGAIRPYNKEVSTLQNLEKVFPGVADTLWEADDRKGTLVNMARQYATTAYQSAGADMSDPSVHNLIAQDAKAIANTALMGGLPTDAVKSMRRQIEILTTEH